MDARYFAPGRILCLIVLCQAAATSAFAASARTQNFIVTTSTQELANEIAGAAEKFRKDLAIEWLGKELPNWEQPCPITAQVDPRHGAGGATSFIFGGGRPHGWTMNIQGSRERVLDSVLPHEVTHTIFASHFCRPLPRWADEGACTTVEHVSERKKQEKLLYSFLTTNRGIPFNRMFAMKDYPADILPLYSQGYSLARFLIALGGKPKFVDYVGEGMNSNNWTLATKNYYGFRSLSDLQLSWVEWVRKGTPKLADANEVQYVSTDPALNGRTLAEVSGQGSTAIATREVAAPAAAAVASALPSPPTRSMVADIAKPEATSLVANVSSEPGFAAEMPRRKLPPPNQLVMSEPAATGAHAPAQMPAASDGWYARKREEAQNRRGSEPQLASQPRAYRSERAINNSESTARPQSPDSLGQPVLELSREGGELVPLRR